MNELKLYFILFYSHHPRPFPKRHSRQGSFGSDISRASTLFPPTHSQFLNTLHAQELSLESGILFEYYQGQFDTLPEFQALPEPNSVGIMNTISVNATTEPILFSKNKSSEGVGNFAVRMTGYLYIPHP